MVQPESNIEDLDDNVAENRADSSESDCESEHSQHNTDTEQSDQEEEGEGALSGETYLGRDNSTAWYGQPLQRKTSVKRRKKEYCHIFRDQKEWPKMPKQLWIRSVYFFPMI